MTENVETTEKTYPAHYSDYDVKTIAFVLSWIKLNNYKQAALARLARVSGPALNQILNGSYASSPTKQLMAVESAITSVEASNSQDIGVVETSVFKLCISACTQARTYRNFAVISGYVGTGKTFALKNYAVTNGNVYLIESTPTMTVNSMIKLLVAKVLKTEVKGSIEDKFQAVASSLANTDSLVIVDEAETLTPKTLHIIRRLRDIAGIGIVLSGTEHLRGIIQPERGQFDQIRSRAGFFPATITGIKREDAEALIQASFLNEDFEEDFINRLWFYSKGSARMLVEGLIAGLRQFREGRKLTAKLVDAVAVQALCLKALTDNDVKALLANEARVKG